MSASKSSQYKPSAASAKPQVPDEQRPCYSHFKTADGLDDKGKPNCKFGAKCRYSHDEEVYMEYYGLKYCPNNCGGKCKETSKQCGACTEQWKMLREEENERRSAESKARWEEKQARWTEINSRPDQQCRGGRSRDQDGYVIGKGWNCPNMTKMEFCKSCHATQQDYMVKRS